VLRRLRYRRKAERCLRQIREAQDTVAAHVTHYYYEQSYRAEEHLYWTQLPGWIAEFARRRTVVSALDAGCAYGTLLVYTMKAAGCAGYAVDFRDTYLSKSLIASLGIHFAVCNIEQERLPWEHRFDVILFTEVLEHLNFQAAPTLRKLRDALTEDGRLFLSTPNRADWGPCHKYYRRYADLPEPRVGEVVVDDHVWHFSAEELLELLDRAGLQVVRCEDSPGVGGRHFNVEARARL
jgi:2-polyprenyl-3-methyl-5-hydroxy-6-metoxy-1,4-benzoquinol methylase